MVKHIKTYKLLYIYATLITAFNLILVSHPLLAAQCGKGEDAVQVGFDIGCRGEAYPNAALNPIIDMAFALFRFLSAGVGLIVIGSVIYAGIQYSTARGNPQATQAAIKRISNSIIGLILYIFLFSLANFLIPGGIFI